MTDSNLPPAEHWVERVQQRDRTFWWRGPMGTYKANNPEDPGHTIVGHQDTLTVEGVVLGAYPELGEVLFESDLGPRTLVRTREELHDVFYAADGSE